MDQNITISLSRDEAVVLLEFFARFDERDEFVLRHNAEYLAFSRISAQLDEALVEPFKTHWDELLIAARNRLASGYEGRAPGVIDDAI
ncbi:MAG TPA: hypothetical protein VFC46_17680 [Humisphaera sp.]|nr:hypothetical protein [Humisphaera sp.]